MSLSKWSLSLRNYCRERARQRHSRMAATIRRSAVSGAICLVSARRGTRPVTGTSGETHEGNPCCETEAKVPTDMAPTVPGSAAGMRRW
jgi:hypothetical protein